MNEYAGSIERLNLVKKLEWQTLIACNDSVERYDAAVVAISADKLAVFGGMNKHEATLNHGYIFNYTTSKIRPILGKDPDLAFRCESQIQWIGQ